MDEYQKLSELLQKQKEYINLLKDRLEDEIYREMLLFSEKEYYRNRVKLTKWHAEHKADGQKTDAGLPFAGKGVVYSAITGGYDRLWEPEEPVDPAFDYIMFTDDKDLRGGTWQIRYLENPERLDATRLARRVKILGHEYLQGYDWSVWIDGKMALKGDRLGEYIRKYRRQEPLLCFNHYERDCIYEEAAACIRGQKDDAAVIEKQMQGYRAEGYPEHAGLVDSAVLVRELHHPGVQRLMELWWHEVQNKSRRDQLSFNYACWKQDFVYDTTDLYAYNNPYIWCRGHREK